MRLELRLPSDKELVELFRVAEGGIHPPDEMPFASRGRTTSASMRSRSFIAERGSPGSRTSGC